MGLLGKSFVLQIQEVTCELKGTRLGGRPDVTFLHPCQCTTHTSVVVPQAAKQCTYTGVTYSNVILDTYDAMYHTHQCDCTTDIIPRTTMQCTTHTCVIVPQMGHTTYYNEMYHTYQSLCYRQHHSIDNNEVYHTHTSVIVSDNNVKAHITVHCTTHTPV